MEFFFELRSSSPLWLVEIKWCDNLHLVAQIWFIKKGIYILNLYDLKKWSAVIW